MLGSENRDFWNPQNKKKGEILEPWEEGSVPGLDDETTLEEHLGKLKAWRQGLLDRIAGHKARIKDIDEELKSLGEEGVNLPLFAERKKLNSEIDTISGEIVDVSSEITRTVIKQHEARENGIM